MKRSVSPGSTKVPWTCHFEFSTLSLTKNDLLATCRKRFFLTLLAFITLSAAQSSA